MTTTGKIKFGVDVLIDRLSREMGSLRVGLVTNDASVTAVHPEPVAASRIAIASSGIRLVRLFSPEHGISAAAPDGEAQSDAIDAPTGLPVSSLYGESLRPSTSALRDLDVLMFDVPDVGARVYTYIWTLSYVLEAAADAGIPLWVLDRPNPLGGEPTAAEGPMLDRSTASYVGRWNIPVRHSLTMGELATLWNEEREIGASLRVIRTEGWSRKMLWPDTGLPFIPPSPSMPDFETALLYPGTCLLEGTNLSEGRGTATPLRVMGAPWIDGFSVADEFNALDHSSVRARTVTFTPRAGEYSGIPCNGIMLHVTDPEQFRPVQTGIALISLIRNRYPSEFRWQTYPTAVNPSGTNHFERLTGSREIRKRIDQHGLRPMNEIRKWTNVDDWTERVKPVLLYDP